MNEVRVELTGQDMLRNNSLLKPASWLTKISFINHLVLFNNVLMAVMAEKGGGKTSFVSLMSESLDSAIKPYVLTAGIPFDSRTLLSQLTTILHLREESILNLASVIDQINERKTHVLVIIDNAHHIPDSFLQQLLDMLKSYKETNYFHVCLVSDFSLTASLGRFDAEQFKNMIHTIELGALTENEMKTYLLKTLPAPKRIDKTMTDKRLEQFYYLTGGYIARINGQMLNFFNPDPLKPAAKKGMLAKKAGMAASLLIAGAAAGYVWQNAGLLIRQTDKILSSPSKPEAFSSGKIASVNLDDYLPSEIPNYYKGAILAAVQPPPLKKIYEENMDDGGLDKMVVMDKVVVIPKEIHKTNNPAVTQTVTQNLFTIQLRAAPTAEELKRFLAARKIAGPTYITQSSGGTRYILVWGQYKGYSVAKEALQQLSPELAQLRPSVISVKGLKTVS